MLEPHPDVLFRELDGESVLLDLGSGTYFGLNEVGTRIWQLIQQRMEEGEIVRHLAAEYDADEATIRADLERLVTDLESRRLVTRSVSP